MKDRFWSAFYWVLIAYTALTLFTLIFVKVNYTDVKTGERYRVLPPAYFKIERTALFAYINYDSTSCSYEASRQYEYSSPETIKKCKSGNYEYLRKASLDNYYPFLLILFLSIIRWVSVGKHIWQRP